MRTCGHGYRWLSCRVLHSACRGGLSVLLALYRTFVVNSQYLFLHESRRAGLEVAEIRVAATVPPQDVPFSLDAGRSEKTGDLAY